MRCTVWYKNKGEEKPQEKFWKMSEYNQTQRSSLKLKGVEELSAGKKKKKKNKESKHRLEQVVTNQSDEEEVKTKKAYIDKRTPAQIAFDKTQEKRQMERILKKASKTHKHRVEDFNRHLDNLTEHYDIPKVSWTK
ncbi:Protein FAM32A-like [Characodon lateralis]|uniref:Protein FAM32A-like n=1 Tax=Characodon lateralis TaxID=208331 RepID=A0ABU7D4G3_9TELE|nr:Protein FAM32A-like [Characodon lateralis]